MQTRRDVINFIVRSFLFCFTTVGIDFSRVASAFEGIKKRIVPKGTDPNSLRNQNPEFLDTRNLQVMPLREFGTMGDRDAFFDAERWLLELTGAIQTPLQFTYDEILKLPVVEREVLLVCPGVFANYGRWKGISMQELVKRVQPGRGVSRVIIYGRSRVGDRKEIFTIDEVKAGKVFLSYAVNGEILSRDHGFPLRIVAEGHWGSCWVKYVYKVEFA